MEKLVRQENPKDCQDLVGFESVLGNLVIDCCC